MNSRTFGEHPEEGGEENDWGIYTNPRSILDLQYDYGADMLATLDYPIPPGLADDEKYERVEKSIDSAVECLRLLEEDEKYADWDPTVYAALHGHSHDEVGYYVSKLLERTNYEDSLDGFAVGSLVPLRSGKIEMLVDIVQGATMAIPPNRRDEFALHVFGIGGQLAPLIAALGVDSYDSSTYVQAAQHQDFINPKDGKKTNATELTADEWNCDCPACEELTDVGVADMKEVFAADRSYKPVEIKRDGETRSYMKSDFYALIAHHNFHVFQREVNEVRDAIMDGSLHTLLTERARQNADLGAGLARAASRWPELRSVVPEGFDIAENAPSNGAELRQTVFNDDGSLAVESSQKTSLEHTPDDFDIRREQFEPSSEKPVCLIVSCSDTKPYSDSKTHLEVANRLSEAGLWNEVEKVSVSGLYGPVPQEFETHDAVLSYDYFLTDADTDQVNRVQNRLVEFLEAHKDQYRAVFAYVTTKTYRTTIEEAFDQAGVGTMLPSDPAVRRVTEHFRNSNLDELAVSIRAVLSSEETPEA